MSHIDIIRAWKDEDYRASLSDAERAQLPENPAGLMELTDIEYLELADTEIGSVAGGLEQGISPRPTPPVSLWKCYGTYWGCGGGGSAVDACPSAMGCTVVACVPRTADSCGIVACL